MNMKHVKIIFEDTFSFARVEKTTTVSEPTFNKMQEEVGKIVIDRFNKSTQIHETLKLISVTQI
jgi:hypothetical protein